MNTINLLHRSDCLSPNQALYWKDLLYRTLKIGTELEYAFPKGQSKNIVLPEITRKLEPSNDLNHLGQYGVLDVLSEHCGFEIRVIGRQPYYQSLLEQYQSILKKMIEYDVRVRFTCGLHYHLLTIGLSETLPEIVLANLWNLVRRYAPNLKFLTSTGDKMEALCRRRNHNSHQEMMQLSPHEKSMREIQQNLKKSTIVPEHQNFFNLEHVVFDEKNQVRNFHIEFRFPDADLCSISIVAKTFLFQALVLKAVELSQHGLIDVGPPEEWQQKRKIMGLLSNNDGTLAASDTSQVTPENIRELQAGNQELLQLLKSIFFRFNNNPCYEILSFLAVTPVSLLRIQGLTWEQIESTLHQCAQIESFNWDDFDKKLIYIIELNQTTGQKSMGHWKQAIENELNISLAELNNRLAAFNVWRGITWDSNIGTILFLT